LVIAWPPPGQDDAEDLEAEDLETPLRKSDEDAA
jgi:hypothetical protein